MALRNRLVTMRLTDEEYEALRAMAYLDHVTVSTFMRQAIAGMVAMFQQMKPALEKAESGAQDEALAMMRKLAEDAAKDMAGIQEERASVKDSA